MRPQLDAANVKLVGVGLEELGVEEFVKDKYFDGDLYIDATQQCYKDLGYKRVGYLSGIASLATKEVRDTAAAAKKENISGNLKGDGFQTGGTVVLQQGGQVLLSYEQKGFADHVALSDVLKALGIEAKKDADAAAGGAMPVCNDDVCQMPKN